MQTPPPEEFMLKETKPCLGGIHATADKLTSSYELVQQMHYVYVQVVKARDLQGKDATSICKPYVEIKLGNYKGVTRFIKKTSNPEWNQVFAFSTVHIQASVLEIIVVNHGSVEDEFMGVIYFDLIEISKRVPPDVPLEPQWYKLEDRKGDKVDGEVMLAVWMGNQADEAFQEAWLSDYRGVSGAENLANIRSKVYLSPKLWYLRVNVIEAFYRIPTDNSRFLEVYVKAAIGNQSLTTTASNNNFNPIWNEDLVFVVAEPSEEPLILSVERKGAEGKDELLGRCAIPLHMVDRRLDDKPINSRWYDLENDFPFLGVSKKDMKSGGRIRLRICLEGGYHVLDQVAHYSSDLRPTAKQLWKPSIGILDLGILGAQNLSPVKATYERGTTDAYCVAKYGQKWVRTRTITDSVSPQWNEQYSWDVFDPCTVVTIGVFDNCNLQGEDKAGGVRDFTIGKVRIRLSTLEIGRIYTHLYPLLVLRPSGLKKMGEIHLAVRFTSSSILNMLHLYSQPLLPKMHHSHPLSVTQGPLSFTQIDFLRHEATKIISLRLSCVEPPLRKEVVEYMLDAGSHMWSLRRIKANFFRIMQVLSGIMSLSIWFDQICKWKNPYTTFGIHVLFAILVLYPQLVIPSLLIYFSWIWVGSYRWRARHPPHVDARFSRADIVHADELDEEFDTFPTSRSTDIVRMRYDHLRSIAGRLQTVVGDVATQGERLQFLLSWRDPRATVLFVILSHVAAVVLYFTPLQLLVLFIGFYILRHPRFRNKHPSLPWNFFTRLPARTDSML